MTQITSKNKARIAAEAAGDKKAEGIVILEMKNIFPVCDYFVIASGESTRKVKAISENIKEKLSQFNIRHWHVEGFREGQWVLLDYSDVVIHIFLTETRDFYDLERLWGDAPRETISQVNSPS